MAVTFVNASTPQTGFANTMAVDLPASLVVGNLLVVILRHSSASAATTGPGGWTAKINTSSNVAVWWRRVDGTEGATATFQAASLQTLSDGVCLQLSGAVATGDPFDVTAAGNVLAANVTSASLSVTTTVANTYLLYTDQRNAATRTLQTAPTGMTSLIGEPTTTHVFGATQAAAGGSGSKSATFTATSSHYNSLLAIKPELAADASRTATASLTATGNRAAFGEAARSATVSLTATGVTNITGGASLGVTTTITPTESTLNEAEGTSTVVLEGTASTGVLGDAARTATATLSASVQRGTLADASRASTVSLEAEGRQDTQGGGALSSSVALSAEGIPGAHASLAASVALSADSIVARFSDSEIGVEATITAAGSANLDAESSMSVAVSLSAGGLAVRRFLTPTQDQSMPDHFWGRYEVPVGVSLVKVAGHYATLPTPTHDELEAVGDEGTHWFRGGYEYIVSEEVWDALVADGFAQA